MPVFVGEAQINKSIENHGSSGSLRKIYWPENARILFGSHLNLNAIYPPSLNPQCSLSRPTNRPAMHENLKEGLGPRT